MKACLFKKVYYLVKYLMHLYIETVTLVKSTQYFLCYYTTIVIWSTKQTGHPTIDVSLESYLEKNCLTIRLFSFMSIVFYFLKA